MQSALEKFCVKQSSVGAVQMWDQMPITKLKKIKHKVKDAAQHYRPINQANMPPEETVASEAEQHST